MSTTDNAQSQLRYPCPVCGNTFTRPQHVVRHLRSHTGERPYKCKECGDAFARSDLLSRHVNKCHPDLANSGPPQNSKQPKRRACEHCAHTGSRCDSNSPCASCVEQGVPCSRMPKALSHHHHHHHPPQMPSIPPPLPGYSDSRLPSLNTTVPSSYGASHRRNPSETSISDWSSDSSRSRLPPYSQPMMYSGSSGYESSSSVDSMSHRGGNSGLSWVPSSSSISSNNSNNPLDQATMTPSQVRAMYGGSLPSGYSHPSQFPASSLPAPPASMSLPNPAALPSLSNLPGPTGLHHLDNNYADTSAYAPLVAGTYGNTGSGNKLPSSSSTIGYAQRAPPRSSASIVRPRDRSKPYPYSPPSPSSSASRTSVGHIGQQSASLTPAPAWKDYAGPQGASNAYNYDAIAADFSSQGAVVPSMGHAGYPTSDDGHSHSSGSPPNTAPSGGNASGRPSLPGLESFMTATFPPLNNVTLPSSAAMAAQSSSSSSNPPHSATSMSAPGMAYLYGRGGDRRSSIASSADSFAYGPPSPSDGSVASSSRPGTSNGSVILPNAFGSLQLRGPDGLVTATSPIGESGKDNAPSEASAAIIGTTAAAAAGGESSADPKKYRQLWSAWLNTPFSSSSDKEAFLLSSNANTNSLGNVVPTHPHSPSKTDGYQGYIPPKSMSLPSIRTPSGERRQPFLHGVSGQLNDASTPRPPSQAHINMSPDEVLKYQEACFARDETPALTLQPPRSRHASVSGGGSGSVTPPGTESTHDDEHHSSPRSVGSGGSGSGSGSGGGSAASIRSAGRVYVPSNVSATSGGSPSAALWQMYSGAQGGGMSVPEPEPHLAKANMDLAGQLGTEQFLSLAGDIGATTGGTSLRPRPSFKRLASQSLGPDSTKSARVEGGDEAEDDVDAGFSIPRPPPFLAGHGRKRSNSSPSQSNSASNLAKLAMTGAGGVFNFHHGVPSLSPSPVPTVGLGIAHN